MSSNSDIASILERLVDVMERVQQNTERTAEQTARGVSGSALGEYTQRRFQDEGPTPHNIFQVATARKALGVRGARALGFRLPNRAIGIKSVLAAKAGGLVGAATSEVIGSTILRPLSAGAKSLFQDISSFGLSGRAFDQAFLDFASAVPGAGRDVNRINQAIAAGAQRTLGVLGNISRGGGRIDPATEKLLMRRFVSEELMAAAAAKRVEDMKRDWKAAVVKASNPVTANPAELQAYFLPQALEAGQRILGGRG